jgi:sarcosine oxidase subunit alpha
VPLRTRPLRDPVTILFDGDAVPAERGEPVAAALVAAGKIALARSAKFHRPRGPACLRAACDGCLARVDGAPNVMTCMVPAREGTEVTTQNTLGSRETDLLRMTDWFFPNGMNHHELFAGVPGLQGLMQSFARRVAGLGKLPAATLAERPAARRAADVVVVGGGAAAMAIAARAAEKGRAVEVIDDSLELGGSSRALHGDDHAPWAAIRARFDRAAAGGAITRRTETTAAALFGDDLLVAGEHGAQIVNARALVLAPGAHDGSLAFEGNDVPGVMSARAGSWLLAQGILAGARVVVAIAPESDGAIGESFARAAAACGGDVRCEVEVVRGAPIAVDGSSRVKTVVFLEQDRERRIKADALLIDAPRAPAYELCEQAGAPLDHEARGFVPRAPNGKIRDGVFALGEVTGARLDAGIFEAQAEAIAGQI